MRLFKSKLAQSTVEYAIVFSIVIGAAIAMQVYVRRGLQGGIGFVADKLSGGKSYEPYSSMSEAETTRTGVYSSEQTLADGEVIRILGKDGAAETTTRKSKQQMRETTADDQEY